MRNPIFYANRNWSLNPLKVKSMTLLCQKKKIVKYLQENLILCRLHIYEEEKRVIGHRWTFIFELSWKSIDGVINAADSQSYKVVSVSQLSSLCGQAFIKFEILPSTRTFSRILCSVCAFSVIRFSSLSCLCSLLRLFHS